MQLIFKTIAGATLVSELEASLDGLTLGDVRQCVRDTQRIPIAVQRLVCAGKHLSPEDWPCSTPLAALGIAQESVIYVSVRGAGLLGGKGGFGAQLRIMAKQAGKQKTTDFGMCRDLSGRRLRHVNDEKVLQHWKDAKERGEGYDPADTPSGINNWFLPTPTWAEGTKLSASSRNVRARRKTTMCKDWLAARVDRPAPRDAPASWGCPRGRRCEFAHGDAELRGEAGADAKLRNKGEDKKMRMEERGGRGMSDYWRFFRLGAPFLPLLTSI